MRDYRKFYIDGRRVDPTTPAELEVVNPATDKPAGVISMGSGTGQPEGLERGCRLQPSRGNLTSAYLH